MGEWIDRLRALWLELWPWANARAVEAAERKGREAGEKVRTLEDAQRAAEGRK